MRVIADYTLGLVIVLAHLVAIAISDEAEQQQLA
jgi:hypothetical protein